MSEIKPSFDSNRQVLGKVYPLSVPFNMILDTSERCNLKCNYCFRSQSDKNFWGYAKDNEMMSWKLFCHIIEQIKKFPGDIKQISLSGHGEPLCNPLLPEMAAYIKKENINSRVSIHTNGVLLRGNYAKQLADSNIDRLVISVQGITSEGYKKICDRDIDFNEFYYNLKEFYHYKKTTEVCIKIMDLALKEGEDKEFYKLFSMISDKIFIEKVVPIWKGEVKESGITYNKYGHQFKKQNCCPVIFHTMMVTPKGDVFPCTQLLFKDKLGNINKNSLYELWNSDIRRELLCQQLKHNPSESCKDCYILQNSILKEEDMIDDYKEEILHRMMSGKMEEK